jgi:hypothetical protein
MKKTALPILIIVSICITSIAFAQKKDNVKFSVGAELAFASGNLSNTHSFGLGGTALVEIPIQEKLNAVAYGGILFYNGKSAGVGLKNKGLTIIPIRVGVKYFLTGSVYTSFQAGLGFLGSYGTGTAFSYSPQIGYEFQTNSGKAIDLTFKYDGYSKNGSIGSFGFRLAYIL